MKKEKNEKATEEGTTVVDRRNLITEEYRDSQGLYVAKLNTGLTFEDDLDRALQRFDESIKSRTKTLVLTP